MRINKWIAYVIIFCFIVSVGGLSNYERVDSMSLTKYTADTNIISGLADLPNATSGLTSAELKGKFDENPTAMKAYINNTLIAELDAGFETKDNLTTNRKLSSTGDFTGTLNGTPITATDPGLSSAFDAFKADFENRFDGWAGKKGNALGDSMTEAFAMGSNVEQIYFNIAKKALKMGSYNNYGISGTSITANVTPLKVSDLTMANSTFSLLGDESSIIATSPSSGSFAPALLASSKTDITFTVTGGTEWYPIGGTTSAFTGIALYGTSNIGKICDFNTPSFAINGTVAGLTPANIGDEVNISYSSGVYTFKKKVVGGADFVSWFTVTKTDFPSVNNWGTLAFGIIKDDVRDTGNKGIVKNIYFGAIDNNAMSVRYSKMDETADLVTVLAGTNDFGKALPLGTVSNRHISTFYGALNIMMDGILTNNPTATVILITPPQRDFADSGTPNGGMGANSAGFTMQQYVDAIIQVANSHAIPVLDLWRTSGINRITFPQFTFDNLHPNISGHARIGSILSKFVRQF